MPVTEPGFIFKYFDKAILGLAVLGLLVAAYMAISRTASVSDQVDLQAVPGMVESIQQEAQQPQEVEPAENYIPRAERALASVPPDNPNLRRFIFWPPIPDRSYEELRVGVGRRVVLDFNAPITPGSLYVRQQGIENPVEIVEHPYDGDFSRVEILTKPYPEAYATIPFTLIGLEGKVPHLRPLVIDRTIDKTPYAPQEVELEVALRSVLLSFKPAPEIEEEEVDVVHYEVFRKDWSNPLAEYVSVGTVQPTADGERREGFEPEFRDRFGEDEDDLFERPWLRDRDQDDQEGEDGEDEEDEARIYWTDESVLPGRRYTYKIRTVGANTFPEKGNVYTDPLWARMAPAYDLRVLDVSRATLSGPARAAVQIMSLRGDVAVRRVPQLTAGDAIAPVREDQQTGELDVWRTGMTVLRCDADLRRRVGGRIRFFQKRIVFVGPDGSIQVRWEMQVPESTQEIWNQVSVDRRGPRR